MQKLVKRITNYQLLTKEHKKLRDIFSVYCFRMFITAVYRRR